MQTKDLQYYCSKFARLRRDFKNGGAPHKPILLISLIQAFQSRFYTKAEIPITPEFIGFFKSNWRILVNSNHQCIFTLPFYYMASEPFWRLVPNNGCELWVKSKGAMRSFSNLVTAIKFAEIDEELKNILLCKNESDILLNSLLDQYFPSTKSFFRTFEKGGYISDVENDIVNDSNDTYQKKLIQLKVELDSNAFQEEVYFRNNVFKKEIPKVYNYTCSISELRIDAVDNISMIDACHIIPFSESYNDTISNGIALCPNLHRAFDRGLVSIDDDYKVVIKKNFSEPFSSVYGIKQFEGKKILLPDSPQFYPSIESLAYHRNKFGFN